MFDLSQDQVTEGSIPRALLALAAPLVAQNLVHVVNQVVDTFWVGRLGTDAVAAVGLSFPVQALVAAAALIPFVGTQILVSQRVGAGDRAGARRIAVHGLALAFVLGVVVAFGVALAAEEITALLAPADVAGLAATYLGTLMLGFPFVVMSDAVEGGFTGWGDTRAALVINLAMAGANVALDPLLILGLGPFPRLAVRGAALATAGGYLAGFLLAIGLALGAREFSLSREAVAFDAGEFRELLDVGAPIFGQRAVGQAVRVVVVALVGVVGGAAGLAAYTVGARVASVAFIPAQGLQQAAQSMIGQNLGADRPDRALRTTGVGVAIAVAALVAVGAGQWLVPRRLATLFVPGISAAALALTVEYLRVLAYGYWAIGATYLLLAGFNGARRTRTSLVVDLLKYWGVRLPIAVLALPVGYSVTAFGVGVAPGLGLGVEAVFWAVTGSNVVAALGVGAYFWYTARDGMFERAADRARPAD